MGEPLTERRKNNPGRRKNLEDRRNAERVAEDLAPRRDPEKSGRRKSD